VAISSIVRDITERRKAEEAVRLSNIYNRSLIEASLDPLVTIGPDGKITDVNTSTETATGRSRYELIGTDFSNYFTDPEKANKGYQLVFREGLVRDYQLEIQHKNGRIIPVLYNASIYKNEVDEVTGIFAAARDITELKIAEETLRQSEEKYRNLFNNMIEGFILYEVIPDSEGNMKDLRYVEINKVFEKTVGAPRDKILGNTVMNFFPQVNPHYMESLAKTASTGQSQRIEWHSPILDRWFESHSYVYKPGYIGVVFRDITERKKAEEKIQESEEKYRTIIETANEGIWIVDPEFRTTYVNEKMAEMFGYSLEEMIDRPGTDFTYEEGKDIAKPKLEKRQQGTNEIHEFKFIRKDGSPIWVLASSKSLFDKCGKFTGSLGMFVDISERKKAEEALAKIEIARKQEIHHRIKNNLQVICSLLDLQAEKFNNREDIKDSEVLDAFKESQDRVISMALIHEELYKGGGIDTLDFSSYIEELAGNLFLTYRLRDTDISLNMDLEENIFFDMDTAVPLGMIVNELVSNSLKHAFIGRDKGEIRIKLYREESSEFESSIEVSNNEDFQSTCFTMAVSDNGLGIPENLEIEDLDSLGFQLVTSLVDQLDGELELKRNNGTEFTMRFTVTEKKEQVSNI